MKNLLNHKISPRLLEEEKEVALSVKNDDLDKLAERFRIKALESVSASYVGTNFEKEQFDLSVWLCAKVHLVCVDTGDVFDYSLEENFILRFDTKDVDQNADDLLADPPLYVESYDARSSSIDLGEILLQYLALALPDSPKAPWAETPLDSEQKKVSERNPFDVLRALKR